MQPAVVAQREAGSCRMSGEQAVRAGQVAPVATQRGPTPLQSTTIAREGLARPLWHGSMHDPERSTTSAERSTRNPEPSPSSNYSCKTVQTPNLHPAKTQKGRGVTILNPFTS